jgi:hypothetical protein
MSDRIGMSNTPVTTVTNNIPMKVSFADKEGFLYTHIYEPSKVVHSQYDTLVEKGDNFCKQSTLLRKDEQDPSSSKQTNINTDIKI